MALVVGPVLSLRAATSTHWNISVLVGTKKPADISFEVMGGTISVGDPTVLFEYGGVTIFRYDFSVPLGDGAQEITYNADGESWSFNVPAAKARPQMVFVSCNGFSSGSEATKVDDTFAMWKKLLRQHDTLSYNLMIMGGDQVYTDEIWTACRDIERWSKKPVSDRRKAQFTKRMDWEVRRFYFNLYANRWMEEDLRTALASIPTTMMWDDHDIFDGWGSHPKEDQDCDVFQGIFQIAKEHFRVFQQQIPPTGGDMHPASVGGDGYSNILKMNKIAVLTLDARSQRSQKKIIEGDDWNRIYAELDGLEPNKYEHVFVVAPVPVVHADFALVEKLGGFLLKGMHLEDDMRDHWQNAEHRVERLRLIHRLFSAIKKINAKITILSGDVHVACFGQIDMDKGTDHALRIDQLTSSGIIHPAPPGLMGWLLHQLSQDVEMVDQGVTAQMNEFPSHRTKYLLERNFLSIEPDDKGRIWANWFVEDFDDKVTKVIHPLPVATG